MTLEELTKLFDKEFPNESFEFCGCHEGDLMGNWPEGKEKLLKFILKIVHEN